MIAKYIQARTLPGREGHLHGDGMNLQSLREHLEILGSVVREVDPEVVFSIVHRFDDIYDLDTALRRFEPKDRTQNRCLLH